MNEVERLELLRQVAECAPYDWNVAESDIDDYDQIFLNNTILHLSGFDVEDAPAIITMLDEIEKRGWLTWLDSGHLDGDPLEPLTYCCTVNDKNGMLYRCSGLAPTRAEAVARAFVAVMTGDSSHQPLNTSVPSTDVHSQDPAKGDDVEHSSEVKTQ
jgi:hypothetical protein